MTNNTMEQLNAGIIGYGGMGQYHHKNLPADAGFRFTAAYDINPEKTKIAEANGLTPCATLESLLQDESIKLVVIATPNNFHKELAIRALEAGKNVVCEKPAAMNSAELSEMIAASKRCGRLMTIHQNRRWDKDFLIVKKVLEDKTIGAPFYIESRVQGANGVPGDWRCVKEAGGGMLLDWGVHLIDQMMYLVKSKVTDIYVHMLKVKFPDVDDNFKLLLRFENGLSALVEVDTYCFEPLPRWHVSGDQGTMVINGWDCSGSITRANLQKMNYEPGIVYTASGPTRTMAPRPVETIEKVQLPDVQGDWGDFYRNVRAAIDGHEELIVKPTETLRVMNVIDRVFESAREGVNIKCSI